MIRPMTSADVPRLRKALLERQGGLCLICKGECKAPCLDHHHKKRVKGTGQIRGVLCRQCNVLIAKMENNCVRYGIDQEQLPRILRSMADYLEKPHHPYLHPSENAKAPRLKKSSYNQVAKLLIKAGKKAPEYPKSGKLIKSLEVAFHQFNLAPEYYK